jgi:hypothetical protein
LDIAKAAAAACNRGKGRIGSNRSKPQFVRERMVSPRRLIYRDFIGPVKTPDEIQLFSELTEQHSSSSSKRGGVSDWTAFTRDWNMKAFENVAQAQGKVITFKQVPHLKDYSRSLAKKAGQVQAAAIASSSEPQQQQQQQQQPDGGSDTDTASVLYNILQECAQQLGVSGAGLQLPPILQQLLTGTVGGAGTQLAAPSSSNMAAAAALGGSDDSPIPAPGTGDTPGQGTGAPTPTVTQTTDVAAVAAAVVAAVAQPPAAMVLAAMVLAQHLSHVDSCHC